MYRMAGRQYREALASMRQLEDVFEQKGLWNVRITFYLMKAVCYMLCGEIDNALLFFSKAYDLSNRRLTRAKSAQTRQAMGKQK
jgi:tetratricopeptide (TPR) repeat protein